MLGERDKWQIKSSKFKSVTSICFSSDRIENGGKERETALQHQLFVNYITWNSPLYIAFSPRFPVCVLYEPLYFMSKYTIFFARALSLPFNWQCMRFGYICEYSCSVRFVGTWKYNRYVVYYFSSLNFFVRLCSWLFSKWPTCRWFHDCDHYDYFYHGMLFLISRKTHWLIGACATDMFTLIFGS